MGGLGGRPGAGSRPLAALLHRTAAWGAQCQLPGLTHLITLEQGPQGMRGLAGCQIPLLLSGSYILVVIVTQTVLEVPFKFAKKLTSEWPHLNP